MKRRAFITLLGGAAAAWPLAPHAQETANVTIAMEPQIEMARVKSAEKILPNPPLGERIVDLAKGFSLSGAEGIGSAWEASPYIRPADVFDERCVFVVGANPVQLGLVASLNRPGGNLTGFNVLASELGAKGLALLHELVPGAATIGFLENPNNPIFGLTTKDVLAAAPVVGLKVQILKAGTDREIDTAFASLVQTRTGALLVGNDVFFNSRIEQIVALAARHAIPTMYPFREFAVAGGLSYGTRLIEEYRQVGLYTGRILKGEKPADLPVIQPTKFELIINLKTARASGLQIPDKLLALADEVIE
jgi:putative tryptophan/tyrosine transport system substrate-binding protein